MFAVDKSLSIGKLCEKTGLSMVRLGFASCGRASLTLPRAILRKASEKAGAGMCRLDFFDCPAFTGMEFPTACQSKKPAVYRQRAFSYFRDSVGIRTQDPQLRRLLLYPAELPNHPMYPFGRQMPVRTNRTANIVIFQRIARLF